MSEIMKADFAEAVPFQQLRKLRCDIVRLEPIPNIIYANIFKEFSVIGASTYGGEFFPVVAKATPIAGKQVYMLGATSGETVGKITRTGVSVQFPPYVTLTDMCEGNYECNPGDSGAGLFDSGAKDVLTASSNAKTYGIQSSGKFNEKGEWIGPSYFTPISNVS